MKIDLLGVKINNEKKGEILSQIESRLSDEDKAIFIVTPYSESIVAAQKDEEFRKVLNSADFALPDGAGVAWATRFLGSRIDKKIPGREFFWDLCELAEKRGEPIFLLGGFGDTPEVVAKKLQRKFPGLRLAGVTNAIPEPKVVNDSGGSFLFVALGPIFQEKWIYKNLPKLHVKLAMGVGGTFDYIAGKRPLPPQILSDWGLEWLWRLVTQPWRALRITKGVLGLIWYTLKARM